MVNCADGVKDGMRAGAGAEGAIIENERMGLSVLACEHTGICTLVYPFTRSLALSLSLAFDSSIYLCIVSS